MKNILIVLSGPSGVGKGTIIKKLTEEKGYIFSISCTTRAPRQNEIDGKDYFFIDKKAFLDKINNNEFLEYSNHFENYYGTPKQFIFDSLKKNDVILDIDVDGGLNVKKNYQDAVLIMLLPPSIDEIRKRLVKRNTESIDDINLRMERINYELGKKDLYDYCVVNDDIEKCKNEIEKIINKEKNKI